MTLEKTIQKEENKHNIRKKAPYVAGLALTMFLNTANLQGATQYQVGAYAEQSNVTKVVQLLKDQGLDPYTIKKGKLTMVITDGSKKELERIMGSPVIRYHGKLPTNNKKEQTPQETKSKTNIKEQHVKNSQNDYLKFCEKIKQQVVSFKKQERLKKDAAFLAQFYDNFSTSDLINVVRCVDKEGGGTWDIDEYTRKVGNIGDIVPIIADIGNRWITAKYDPQFKMDFNGPGEVSFQNIVSKKQVKKNGRTVYQFSAMMNPNEREKIRKACEKQDVFYEIDNPYDQEKIQQIYEATVLILSDMAKIPGELYITFKDHHEQFPVEYDVLYKTTQTKNKKWDKKTFKTRQREYTKTEGNHNHYTMVDVNTGENLVAKYRRMHAEQVQKRLQ